MVPTRIYSRTPVVCPLKVNIVFLKRLLNLPQKQNQRQTTPGEEKEKLTKIEEEKITQAKQKGEAVRKNTLLAETFSQLGQTFRATGALFDKLANLTKEN